ncbi:hypothetical protein [Streptomyces sp. DSM 41634]|uniref:hypothetical protein n=1 Tax=Streptomyces sp. DSM 41634 TaxID=3448656 RepID=UPI0028841884|nr:hypothetical protein [Streptomyces sp. DSM 41633]
MAARGAPGEVETAVAQAYPHLTKEAKADYDGGRVLGETGVDLERVLAVIASTDLGQDTVPPRELLKDTMAGGTSDLLDGLLSEPGNRCARLLAALGVEPAGLWRPAGSDRPGPGCPTGTSADRN